MQFSVFEQQFTLEKAILESDTIFYDWLIKEGYDTNTFIGITYKKDGNYYTFQEGKHAEFVKGYYNNSNYYT